MSKGFPVANQTVFTCETGINLVSTIINNEFKWIFRPNHNETDFGIDAYVDVVSEDSTVTGQSIALQIKTGESFFRTKTPNGFTFYGDIKHLNYYMNSQLPILIIICDIEKKQCYWEHFDGNRIERIESGWKINIPSNNVLNFSKKTKILKLLPQPVDYLDKINKSWELNSTLMECDEILYTIDRNDIEINNIKPILDFFNRLQINDNLFRYLQGKIEINIFGYYEDKQELFEIKEVREWFKKADSEIKPWFFFLNTKSPAHGFQLYLACLCDAKVVIEIKRMNGYEIEYQKSKGIQPPKMSVQFDNKLLEIHFDRNFLRLNEITDNLGISIEENKKISDKIFNTLK